MGVTYSFWDWVPYWKELRLWNQCNTWTVTEWCNWAHLWVAYFLRGQFTYFFDICLVATSKVHLFMGQKTLLRLWLRLTAFVCVCVTDAEYSCVCGYECACGGQRKIWPVSPLLFETGLSRLLSCFFSSWLVASPKPHRVCDLGLRSQVCVHCNPGLWC